MAHFAKLDENNTVIAVHVVNNNELTLDGRESEDKGIIFLKTLYGEDTLWKQTSYNGTMRKNFAGVGYTYDNQRDSFIPPKPFLSWTLNEETCQWVAPEQRPDDNKFYSWDETTRSWFEV